MNTFQLSCFLAVANGLSFVRAAKQMNVSQPTITNQIKLLENELNVKLFRRSTRLVEITPEGQAFVADARNMVMIAEQAKLRFGNPKERPIETLSIGCSNHIQLEMLTEILRDLSTDYPNLHPQLHVVPHDQLFHLLETETADLVFDIHDGRESKDKLTFKELRRSYLVCLCRSDSPLAKRESISALTLRQEKLIFCDPVNLAPEIAKLQWQLAEDKSPADLHFCSSPEAAVVLARAGFGAALLPELLVPPADDLVSCRIEDAPKLSFGMFYQPYPGDSVLKKFVSLAKRHFSASAEGKPQTEELSGR